MLMFALLALGRHTHTHIHTRLSSNHHLNSVKLKAAASSDSFSPMVLNSKGATVKYEMNRAPQECQGDF